MPKIDKLEALRDIVRMIEAILNQIDTIHSTRKQLRDAIKDVYAEASKIYSQDL